MTVQNVILNTYQIFKLTQFFIFTTLILHLHLPDPSLSLLSIFLIFHSSSVSQFYHNVNFVQVSKVHQRRQLLSILSRSSIFSVSVISVVIVVVSFPSWNSIWVLKVSLFSLLSELGFWGCKGIVKLNSCFMDLSKIEKNRML